LAGIDEEIDGKIFLFFKKPKNQFVESKVCLPVKMPKIVARNILTVVGEFHTGAAACGTALRAEVSGEDALGNDAEVFEFLSELVIE
jgi:hypothetical protein